MISDKSSRSSKVGIISYVTHSSHLNYGATLHGYAFQSYLKKKHNIDSDIIDYMPKALDGENLKYPILNKRGNRSILNNLIVKANWLLAFKSNLKKWQKFNDFISNNLTTSEEYNYSELQTSATCSDLPYPIFVCEADVIWKILSDDSFDENFFLSFPAADKAVKVAYAPTIASKPLEGKRLNKFKSLVSSFAALSARESKGASYLHSILDREVSYCLDPTLLLDESDYEDIIVEPNEKDDYLLIYTCTVNDWKMVKAATKYGKEHGLKVIEISNYALNRFVVNHTVRTDVGIEEWLGYFKCAKKIITNSFHGLCFSVIFKKDFLVFERDKRDFRMPDIAESLGVKDRLISCDEKSIPSSVKNIDYSDVYKRLGELRIQSDKFIEMNIVNPLKSGV